MNLRPIADEAQNVGRNKTARRQQGWTFPAIGAPETPVQRLTRGQAYSGLRRDVYNDERPARKSFGAGAIVQGRSVMVKADRLGVWQNVVGRLISLFYRQRPWPGFCG